MTDKATRSVNVDLGERSYDILIGEGILSRAGELIQTATGSSRLFVLTAETVHGFHGDALRSTLASGFDNVTWMVRPPGEAQKSFSTLQEVLDGMFEAGLSRGDCLVAFGGGVIGDLGGFAASVFKRGCQFVQIPTTLLAQVDSSVGGKTAINVSYGKNLVGAFYQPALVLSDSSLLKTLPERQLKAGYAEVLKYGLLGDADFFNWLEQNGRDVLALEPTALSHAVAVSCETKARIVAEDERETGKRALLNLGHTFAHALELEAGYGERLLHGEAVSVGMEMAFEYSASQHLCSERDVERLKAHLDQTKMTRPQDVRDLTTDTNKLMAHMGQDKKNESGKLTLILARSIGDAFVEKNANVNGVSDYLSKLVTHSDA